MVISFSTQWTTSSDFKHTRPLPHLRSDARRVNHSFIQFFLYATGNIKPNQIYISITTIHYALPDNKQHYDDDDEDDVDGVVDGDEW